MAAGARDFGTVLEHSDVRLILNLYRHVQPEGFDRAASPNSPDAAGVVVGLVVKPVVKLMVGTRRGGDVPIPMCRRDRECGPLRIGAGVVVAVTRPLAVYQGATAVLFCCPAWETRGWARLGSNQ